MLLSAKGNSGILSVGDPMHFEKFEPDHEDELRCRNLKPRNGLSSSCFHLQIALFCVLLEHYLFPAFLSNEHPKSILKYCAPHPC